MTKKDLVRKELHTLQIERFRFQHLKTRLDKVRGHIVHGSDNSFGFDIQHDIQALTETNMPVHLFMCFKGTARYTQRDRGSSSPLQRCLRCQVWI